MDAWRQGDGDTAALWPGPHRTLAGPERGETKRNEVMGARVSACLPAYMMETHTRRKGSDRSCSLDARRTCHICPSTVSSHALTASHANGRNERTFVSKLIRRPCLVLLLVLCVISWRGDEGISIPFTQLLLPQVSAAPKGGRGGCDSGTVQWMGDPCV